MPNKKDIETVRELTRQYMEIAMSDKHIKMRQRFRDSNDLKIVRPPLIMEEIPWQQMNLDHALDCVCEDNSLRGMEYGLRVALFREKYFSCDNYIEPYWVVGKSHSSTGNGLAGTQEKVIRRNDTGIMSHYYEDVIPDEKALENFHLPVITAYPENDAANVAYIQEIIGDIMPVVLRGHTIYYAPWDVIPRLHGVENVLIDLYERPEFMHKVIKLFTDAMTAEMDQMEALGLYDSEGDSLSLHCTPYQISQPEGTSRRTPPWFRTMAQMFSSISPDMHEEFDMQYSAPLAARCGYTYYGCCEPLHDRIDEIKRNYPNLRKVGASPWADIERTAEALEGNYVMSRKPNPAFVSDVVDTDLIRREISETVKICQKYGCPLDITLKDISTVGGRPENLIEWSAAASAVLDEYYGKE